MGAERQSRHMALQTVARWHKVLRVKRSLLFYSIGGVLAVDGPK